MSIEEINATTFGEFASKHVFSNKRIWRTYVT